MAYDRAFFDEIQESSATAAGILLPHLLSLYPAQSIVDVGCGQGTWLRKAIDLGIDDVLGVDGSYVDLATLAIPREKFAAHDLEQPLTLDRTFDLAICLEVGEHLRPERADSLVDDLTKLAPAVLFSAAIPLQGGTNHINEQWQSYWFQKFAARGYAGADVFRHVFWDNHDAGAVYLQNSFLYCSANLLALNSELAEGARRARHAPRDVVHPAVFLNHDSLRNGDKIQFGRVVKALPFAARRTLARWYYRKFKGS